VLLAREQNLNPAIENLETRYKIGETLRHEPLLICMLVRVAVHAITIGDVNSLAATNRLTDEQLARLQKLLQGIDIHAQLKDSMLGERAWCYHAFHQPMGFSFAPDPNKISNKVRETTHDVKDIHRPEDCAKAIEMLTRMHEAAEQPPWEGIREMNKIDDELKRLMGESPVNKVRYTLTFMLTPAVMKVTEASARGEVLRDLALAGIAARRYRLKHGELPTKLTQLVPDFLPQVPLDSFDGKPLRTSIKNGELVIYSVGKNLVDDGGVFDPRTYEPDIAVEVK
jgi:hypothetical protein